MAILKPSPSSPRRSAAGTTTSVRKISTVPEALTPSLTWWCDRSKPGSRGVDEKGRDAADLLLRVRHGEEETQVGRLPAGDEDFLTRDPVGVALAHRPGLLVPGVGSRVRLGQREAAELLAPGERRQETLLLVGVAELFDRVADERVVDREDDAHVGADPRDLLDHDRIGNDVHLGAAVLRRRRRPPPAPAHRPRETGPAGTSPVWSIVAARGRMTSSAKLRTESRSSCCSSENSRFMGGGVYRQAGARPGGAEDGSRRRSQQRIRVARPGRVRGRAGEAGRVGSAPRAITVLDRRASAPASPAGKSSPVTPGSTDSASPPTAAAATGRPAANARAAMPLPEIARYGSATTSQAASHRAIVLLGDVGVLPEDALAHGARRRAARELLRVGKDLADDGDRGPRPPHDLGSGVEEEIDALVAPHETEEEHERTRRFRGAGGPPRAGVADGGDTGCGSTSDGRPGASLPSRSRSAAVCTTNASAERNAPSARNRRKAPPSWSSTLWQRSTRRVAGDSAATRRRTARYGRPQNAVHHGTSRAPGETAAIASAVRFQDPGER